MEDFGILWVWGFPQVFSVGMGWVWGLKFNPHGSPGSSSSSSSSDSMIMGVGCNEASESKKIVFELL